MYRILRHSWAIAMALFLFATTTWAGEQLNVAVKKATVRSEPRIFAKKLTALSYGDQVEVVDEQRAWYKVRLANGSEGWMQQTALTDDDLELSAGDRQVQAVASDEELTLAGKGFNNEVEKEFRERNRDIDFTWVDRMETWNPSDEQLYQFMQQGGLNTGGDDAR